MCVGYVKKILKGFLNYDCANTDFEVTLDQENYLKTVTGDKSISDWASEAAKDVFNKIADTINGAINGIEGIEKLPRLE